MVKFKKYFERMLLYSYYIDYYLLEGAFKRNGTQVFKIQVVDVSFIVNNDNHCYGLICRHTSQFIRQVRRLLYGQCLLHVIIRKIFGKFILRVKVVLQYCTWSFLRYSCS